MKIVKLGEITDIIGGQIMTRLKTDKPTDEIFGDVKVVVPKAIEDTGIINPDSLATETVKSNVDEKKITREGDFVIKLNAPYDCGMVNEESSGSVVPSFCARIVIKKGYGSDVLIPEYLLAFLNSSSCKKQIEKQVQGSVMGIVSVGKLKGIEVPLPEITTQFSIGNTYACTQHRIQIMKEILKLEKLRNDAMINEMAD